MEFILEAIATTLFEGLVALTKNKKIPRPVRYLLLCVIIVFFTAITIGLFTLGIILLKESQLVGIILIGAAIFVLLGVILLWKKIRADIKG